MLPLSCRPARGTVQILKCQRFRAPEAVGYIPSSRPAVTLFQRNPVAASAPHMYAFIERPAVLTITPIGAYEPMLHPGSDTSVTFSLAAPHVSRAVTPIIRRRTI